MRNVFDFDLVKNCVLTIKSTRVAIAGDNSVVQIYNPTSAALYGPVVTLSTQNDNKLLHQLKTAFQRIIKWNKYRSEMTNKAKTNNLKYLIDLTLSKVNRLFVLSFKINEDDRTSFSKYYTPSFEIKDFNLEVEDFNVLIDYNFFFIIYFIFFLCFNKDQKRSM